ncbi:fungal-specific transcription factor domain-containing protein [Mycena maculata]|uniref:Fungal-specific transcription factor domain-containing protein n=1 Tax=Mycena maculata TaxID=230809 RepID=A0AAD7NMQ7_9AGAR|nr:fungal-specific transcription factor domain-containing protein [Mycena maculata]
MSSNEELEDSAAKKKKAHRPCDMCRRKKRRCDGGQPCGRCIQHEFNCTYQKRAMQRTSAAASYVHSLENRLKTVESLLQESNAVPVSGSPESPATFAPRQDQVLDILTYAIRLLNDPFPVPHSDDLSFIEISDSLQSLSLDNPVAHGFQGKSSQAMLVKAAVDLKSGDNIPNAPRSSLPPKQWSIKPWMKAPPRRTYTFPEDDLMISLISLYFDNVNIFFPIVHRPTFEKAFATNTHIHHDGFADTLLLVCALGARYSEDSRVHLPTVTECGTAGWKWFDQVQLAGLPVSGQATLYDLQCYCLAIQFIDRTSGARASWTLAGIGIRLGVDIGVHRSKVRGRAITPEEEQEKRCYWSIVLFDSQLSGALGRSIALQYDFDLELPLRCDDEYWEASTRRGVFCHPSDKPSLLDFFIWQIKLNRILSFVQKVLYATNRSKTLLGLNFDGWEEKVVMELDSALNAWFDSVPMHLRWDPACENDTFFDQAAALYMSYYLVQILIHRPFIPAVRRAGAPKSFPSLTICNNAARACINVAETQQRRRPNNPLIFGPTALFTAGIVLLLNIWGSSRTNRVESPDLTDVHRCMDVLRANTERWPSAGSLLETLEQLLKVDHAPTVRPRKVYDPSPFASSETGTGSTSSSETPVSAPNNVPHLSNPQMTRGWTVHIPLTAEDAAWANHVDGWDEAPARAPQVSDTADPPNNTAYFPAPHAHGSDLNDMQYFGVPLGDRLAHDTHLYTDTVAFWSTAPTGFEVSDWDLYLSNIGDIMQTGT